MKLSTLVVIFMSIFFYPTIPDSENWNSSQNKTIQKDSIPFLLAQQFQSPFNSQREKVYLHLDRPFFKPGEAIWFNAYLREANTLQPSLQSTVLYVELIAPNGNTLKKLSLSTQRNARKRCL